MHASSSAVVGRAAPNSSTTCAAARTAQREQAKQATAPVQGLTGWVFVVHCHCDSLQAEQGAQRQRAAAIQLQARGQVGACTSAQLKCSSQPPEAPEPAASLHTLTVAAAASWGAKPEQQINQEGRRGNQQQQAGRREGQQAAAAAAKRQRQPTGLPSSSIGRATAANCPRGLARAHGSARGQSVLPRRQGAPTSGALACRSSQTPADAPPRLAGGRRFGPTDPHEGLGTVLPGRWNMLLKLS